MPHDLALTIGMDMGMSLCSHAFVSGEDPCLCPALVLGSDSSQFYLLMWQLFGSNVLYAIIEGLIMHMHAQHVFCYFLW